MLNIDAPTASALLGDRFRIFAEIGRGGQGVVFRALRERDVDGSPVQDEVALKIHTDPRQDERIAREIQVMQVLRHPCLANLLEHGRLDHAGQSVQYIAWEFIHGENLADRLKRGPASPKLAATVGRDVATAIVHIWNERVVHRDVKPNNIMLRVGEREAVLIDLGAARHLAQAAITTVGSTWGTPPYMSPEQAKGETQLTSFSDVFALGVTLLEALLGRHPTGYNPQVLLSGRLSASSLLPLTPSGLTGLLDRMLDPRPARRPTPDVVHEELAALIPLLG